ncbi:MAG: hypothetical protein HY795_14115 [Desulfovibrio sp.]|jgi:hypothetical protein|nr:hypothetical protein [Desulfovibrio sp.]MBI4959474.1 hypothetical protein [Desulfovibrio sp.]
MRIFNFKLILLVGLFVALVVKGGQLCSPDGVQAMPNLVVKERVAPVEPLPIRSVEEDFRGVSPLPALTDITPSARKVDKPAKKLTRKVSKPSTSAKDTSKKSPGKS